MKYADTTAKIIGCAMTVHRKMGNGYPEIVYSRCLAIEFKKAGLAFEREKRMSVFYDEIEVYRRRVDFLVDDTISVEIKAIADLGNRELAQGLNYLEAQRLEIGLLINFGAPSLQFKRLINEQKLLRAQNPGNPG